MLLQSDVSVITKWEAFCFTKQGKQYYKVGQVSQNSIIFMTKQERGVFESGEIITKKSRIVQKGSDISVLKLL